ncbi:electron transfer flavoprotein subunit alpha/FixB family protein [Rapidithrix thailandica]|uniref:Electron transfer flavoprotein subunit alpha/FixB family protein n=1 Tax=Rapidithrix thailandica TaxID=413964 RepID=A0AAW9S563_9BACT
MAILVFVEIEDKSVKTSSIEALCYGVSVAGQTGQEVQVVTYGEIDTESLAQLGAYGAAKVLHCQSTQLNENATVQGVSTLIANAFKEVQANTLVMARSSMVDALASRVGIKVGASVVTNVVSLPDTANGFTVKRSIFTGKAFADVQLPEGNRVITIKKNTVPVEKGEGSAEVVDLNTDFASDDFAVSKLSEEKAEGEVLLPEADIVVSGGRGLKGPENWGMVEELAKLLGAATACSKPVSDMEWRPHHEHVGQTGIKISPNLYIAIGISGAIQHLAGVNSSKVIVVVNKDAEAPFFKAADYGIVGDAFDVVPKLIEAFKAQ